MQESSFLDRVRRTRQLLLDLADAYADLGYAARPDMLRSWQRGLDMLEARQLRDIRRSQQPPGKWKRRR